jgi:hypothetical protein
MDRSNLHTVINDRGGPGFAREPRRPIPLNLFSDLARVAKKVKGPTAHSIGLHWSPRIINPAWPGHVVSTRVGDTAVQFRWNQAAHRYVRYYQGRPDRLADGHAVSTPNVIVQFVPGHVFRADVDPAGNPAWFQHTVGHGRAVVFRDGKRIDGRWGRRHAASGTTLVDTHGKPITLASGGAWVVLVNNGAPSPADSARRRAWCRFPQAGRATVGPRAPGNHATWSPNPTLGCGAHSAEQPFGRL